MRHDEEDILYGCFMNGSTLIGTGLTPREAGYAAIERRLDAVGGDEAALDAYDTLVDGWEDLFPSMHDVEEEETFARSCATAMLVLSGRITLVPDSSRAGARIEYTDPKARAEADDIDLQVRPLTHSELVANRYAFEDIDDLLCAREEARDEDYGRSLRGGYEDGYDDDADEDDYDADFGDDRDNCGCEDPYEDDDRY